MSTAIPRTLAGEIIRLYEEKDTHGRRIRSYAKVAEELGVGETTVYRVVNRLGAYKDIARIRTEDELTLAARESAARFAEKFKLEEELKRKEPVFSPETQTRLAAYLGEPHEKADSPLDRATTPEEAGNY